MEWFLLTFRSTHSAIAAQEMLKLTVDIITMPVLREISASCGIAIKIECKQLAAAKKVITNWDIGAEEYKAYKILMVDGKNVPIEIDL